MGKVKHLMRSLRSKFTPSRSKSSSETPRSDGTTSSPVSPWTEGRQRSLSSVRSSAYASSDTHTPPTSPSNTAPPCAHVVGSRMRTSVSDISAAERLRAEPFESVEESDLGPHATLEVNMAMLDFAKKLPLEELSMIGHGSVSSSLSNGEHNGSSHKECVDARNPKTLAPRFPPRTSSQTKVSSGSSWSFACEIARRTEKEHDEPDENDTASFGSLADWEATHNGQAVNNFIARGQNDEVNVDHEETICSHHFAHPHRNTFYRPLPPRQKRGVPCFQSSATQTYGPHSSAWYENSICSMSPDPETFEYGRVINSPSPNLPSTQSSARLAALPSFTEQSSDSYESFMKYIESPNADTCRPIMGEEDSDALPDWSDVEDDPEYNTYLTKQPFSWSSTASSFSCGFRFEGATVASPAVYIPTGYPGASTTHAYGNAPQPGQGTVTHRGMKRRRSETRELGSASKRARMTEDKRKRWLPTRSTRIGRRGRFTL